MLETGSFSLGIENRYFDFDDYDIPVKTYVSADENFQTLKSFQKYVTMYLRKSEYFVNDDLIQYKSHKTGSYYSIEKQKTDIAEMTDDTILTIRIVQDSIIDQFERSVLTFFEMTGQLGGLYEVFSVVASFIISKAVQKMFTLSIIKNLYYVESKSESKNINFAHKNQISSNQNRLAVDQSDREDEIKVGSDEENDPSMVEDSQVRQRYASYNWSRNENQRKNTSHRF